MIVLGVDTSTDSLSVGLISEEKILAEYNIPGILRHSSLLVPTIEKALKKTGIGIAEVGLYSVGLGPGSFTGLRVGVTAVRALAIASDRPVKGIPTMDAIAHNAFIYLRKKKKDRRSLKICPILDAKKNQVYSCIYSYRGDKIIRESDYLLEPVSALIRRLRGSVLFLGDGVSLCKERLLGKKTLESSFLDSKKWFPRASVIAKAALCEFRAGRSDDAFNLVPMYLYARDCNVRK